MLSWVFFHKNTHTNQLLIQIPLSSGIFLLVKWLVSLKYLINKSSLTHYAQ